MLPDLEEKELGVNSLQITSIINEWCSCSSMLWNDFFSEMDNGEDEFIDVENVLLYSLVVSRLNLVKNISKSEFYQCLSAEIKKPFSGKKTVCVVQKRGNIFCQSQDTNLRRGELFKVNSIDPRGVIVDGRPAAELCLENKQFLIEDLTNLSISFDFHKVIEF